MQLALGLGSNLGPSEEILQRAVADLATFLEAVRVAPLYRTAAEGPVEQPDFLNTALVGKTKLSPDEVLAICQQLEVASGRERHERFGPRTLDIDLLVAGELERSDPELTVPHPRLRARRFVLQPLSDIAPDLAIPPDGATVTDLLASLPDGGIERIDWSRPPLGSV